jgi:hypothetical protein
MKKIISLLLLSFSPLAFADVCPTPTSGDLKISSSCTNLTYTSSSGQLTIDPGVTISSDGVLSNAPSSQYTILGIINSGTTTGSVSGMKLFNTNITNRIVNNYQMVGSVNAGLNITTNLSSTTIGGITNEVDGVISGASRGLVVGKNIVGDIKNYGIMRATTTSGTSGGILYYDGAIISEISNISGYIQGVKSYNNLPSVKGVDADIYNGGATLGTLNNAQGGDSSNASRKALTYTGSTGALLPNFYNIIINSSTHYGQLSIATVGLVNGLTGTMVFGISNLSVGSAAVSLATYSSVLKGITDTQLGISGASLTASSNGYLYTLSKASAYSTDLNWDLLVSSYTAPGPSAANTQSSMQYQASQLRSAFNTQTVAANFALNYDCNIYDVKGMCISAGGRYTTIDNPGINNSAAVVTLGYKVNPNIRIGGYLDQNINISNPTGINISNNTPLMGLYAVWNKEQSGLGYQVRLANTYQDKDVTSTRTVFDTSEAGSGKSSLTSQSYLAELSYAFQYQDRTLVRPYAGLRYTHLKQDGYTEGTVAGSVEDPLTVAALRDKSATALLGFKVQRSLTDKATLTAQLGLEQDLHHKVGNYSATDLNGSDLTAIAFNSNIKRTRPIASIGAFYDVTKTQRASATINYQQLPFQSTGSATAYFNYMIGF